MTQPATTPAALHVPHPMDTTRILKALLEIADDAGRVDQEDPHSSWVVSPWLLRRLLSAIHYRDESTVLHSRRVALLSVGIAEHIGWDPVALRKLEAASLLHDVGKIGIPDHILMKPGRLSPDEQAMVMRHHQVGSDFLQACRVDQEIVELIWFSHMRLKVNGEREDHNDVVPQGARILSVADAYDSLRNDQPYRGRKSHADTMQLLRDQSGKQFDRNVVAALERWIEHEGHVFQADANDADLSVNASAPIDQQAISEASTLCHILGYFDLLESMYDGFYIVDADMRVMVWNDGMRRITGIKPADIVGEPWSRRLVPYCDDKRSPLKDRDAPVQRVLRENRPICKKLRMEPSQGQGFGVEVQALPLLEENGQILGVVEILRDVSQVKGDAGQYRELQNAARRDPLTGVANRGELESRLARMLVNRNEGKSDSPFSVIFLDIDRFKSINDTYGHTVGDRVLVDLTRLIEDELYSGEIVGRYGGEEFVVICPETDLARAVERSERLRRNIQDAVMAKPADLRVTSSFGVAEIEANDTVEKLLHRADEALYEAKRTGRNRTCVRSEHVARKSGSGDLAIGKFVHTIVFEARVAEKLVLYKISGFVDGEKANLTKVEEQRVEMKLGRAGLLGGWGDDRNQQPVKVVVEIGDQKQSGKWDSQMVDITATVTPVGRCTDEMFQSRAAHVCQRLRAYFAAT